MKERKENVIWLNLYSLIKLSWIKRSRIDSALSLWTFARAAACSRGSPTCCNSARRWSSPVAKRDADDKTNWMDASNDRTSLSAENEKTRKKEKKRKKRGVKEWIEAGIPCEAQSNQRWWSPKDDRLHAFTLSGWTRAWGCTLWLKYCA